MAESGPPPNAFPTVPPASRTHRLASFLGSRDTRVDSSFILIHASLAAYSWAYFAHQSALVMVFTDLGGDTVAFGQLQSAIALAQLIGAPFLGRIVDYASSSSSGSGEAGGPSKSLLPDSSRFSHGDTNGPRVGMIVSLASAAAYYSVPVLADSVGSIYLMTIPSLSMHSMLCAQSAVARLTTHADRAVALGRLYLSFGFGMFAGAPCGGWIAQTLGPQEACFVSFVICALFAMVNLLWLATSPFDLSVAAPAEAPGAPPSEPRAADAEEVGLLDRGALRRVLTLRPIRVVLLASVFLGLGTAVFRSMFSVAALEDMKLSASQIGVLMSLGAAASLVANLWLVPTVAKRPNGEGDALVGAAWLLAVTFAGFGAASNASVSDLARLGLVSFLTVPNALASTLFYTVSGSVVSKQSPKRDSATAISLSHAVRSATGIVAPLISGSLMRDYRFTGVTLAATAACATSGAVLLLWGHALHAFPGGAAAAGPQATARKWTGGPFEVRNKEEKVHVS